jgi:hypothetical protein
MISIYDTWRTFKCFKIIKKIYIIKSEYDFCLGYLKDSLKVLNFF